MESNVIFSDMDTDDSSASKGTDHPLSTMETDDAFTDTITEQQGASMRSSRFTAVSRLEDNIWMIL